MNQWMHLDVKGSAFNRKNILFLLKAASFPGYFAFVITFLHAKFNKKFELSCIPVYILQQER